ncbi:MAG: helix-turn-helix domain-containing protein [Candidatus Bathyarchaeia archaeon]|jgi:DNA-binding transcriptional regulator GbsR (MarR family)
MSEEKIKKVLMNSGFTQTETEVYLFLAKHVPLTLSEIAKLLAKDKAQLFRVLKGLQAKGFVESTLEFPTRYTVVGFERVLDSIVEAKRKEVVFIESSKKDFLDYLQKKRCLSSDPSLEKFMVLKGRKKTYAKMSQLVKKTQCRLSVVAAVPNLLRADQFGVFDFADTNLSPNTQCRFLTDVSEQNLGAIKALTQRLSNVCFRVRNPDLGLNMFPRMMIRDHEEILFFTKPEADKTDVCLWTNCKPLVQAFTAVFEDLWKISIDLQEKIAERETAPKTPPTRVLSGEIAELIYRDKLLTAKNEVLLMTTSHSLIGYCREISQLAEWRKNGVSVKIMAPIVSENLEAVEELSKIGSVRHVPTSYLESTVIDGKYLFQFRPYLSSNIALTPNFENTLFTDEASQVEKMKTTLNTLWKHALAPSTTPLEAMLKKARTPDSLSGKPAYFQKVSGLNFNDWKQQTATPSEKDVLDKIIGANLTTDNLADEMKLHGSMATAIIHPPSHFKLPEMILTVFHAEKQSFFGEEDSMLVYLWLATPKGPAYLPVAYVGDNPSAQAFWKTYMTGTPAAQNTRLVSKDEIYTRIHGNTLFAGWTVKIPLLSTKNVLPPSCLLLEGYGNLKTDSFTISPPSGYQTTIERNGFDAFVTFFHPASKYSGPGTDGFFARDYIAVTHPPHCPAESKGASEK